MLQTTDQIDHKMTQEMLGNVLAGLNPNQEKAVESIEGETLVIAGAGSGKTAVLTRRVAYLIINGQKPGNILCLTFTNKAAKEMNQRVKDLLIKSGVNLPHVPSWENDYQNVPLLCTFHALGVRILREFGEYININRDFSILDTADQKKVVKDIMKQKNLSEQELNASLVLNFISKCKQELLLAEDSKKLNIDYLPVFHEIYKAYEEKLQRSNSVDFDDLLLQTYVLLRDVPEVLKELQNRWTHIMIDEFQDTNQAQFEIVKLLYLVD